MGDRRMFSKLITDSDAFLDIPLSTQALYFHLSMKADDDGFVNNPKRIQRLVGASEDDFKLLVAKSFILTFDSGVIVIKHWRINNWIRADRKIATTYTEELDMLRIKENGAYSLESQQTSGVQPSDNQVTTVCQPSDSLINSPNYINSPKDTYNSLEEVKPIHKTKNNTSINIYTLLNDSDLDIEIKENLKQWVEYKKEQFKFDYKPIGFKALITEVSNQVQVIGVHKTVEAIQLSMGKGYKGIIWDLVKDNNLNTNNYGTTNKVAQQLYDSYQMMSDWANSKAED